MPMGSGFDLPPGAEPWSDFHWFSASTKGIRVFVVLSDEPIWYTGHYANGRMAPCSGSGCDYCATGIGSQVRYCIAVADTTTRRVGLVEFGKNNGLQLRDWMNRTGGLPGMVIEVSKHSKNVQSRTELRFIDIPCEFPWRTLEVPDVALALFLTWHKAGFRMPEELVQASVRKMQKRKEMLSGRRDVQTNGW